MKSKVLIFIVVASCAFGVFPLCHAQVEESPNQKQARGGPAGFAVADFITDKEATDKQLENSVKNVLVETIRAELAGPNVIQVERSLLEPILDELIEMVESGFIKPENAEKIQDQIGARCLLAGKVALRNINDINSKDWEKRPVIINARLIRLDEARILKGWSVECKEGEMYSKAKQLTAEIRKYITPPTPIVAALQSTVLPSWGQFSSHRGTSGSLVITGTLGTIAGALWTYRSYSEAEDAYLDATKVSEIERLKQESNDKLARFNLMLGVTAGVWAINVLDAYLETASFRRTIRPITDALKAKPTAEGGAVSLTLRF